MREKQVQNLSSFAATITNSKYDTQKRNFEFALKKFRNHFNYNRITEIISDQEEN